MTYTVFNSAAIALLLPAEGIICTVTVRGSLKDGNGQRRRRRPYVTYIALAEVGAELRKLTATMEKMY